MKLFKKINDVQNATIFGVFSLICMVSFQNCGRIALQDLNPADSSKVAGIGAINDNVCLDCETRVPQAETSEGDVLLPIAEAPRSLFICPEGTESSDKEKNTSGLTVVSASVGTDANGATSLVRGTSSGKGPVSVSAYSDSSKGKSTGRIVQSGDVNTANIYQNGSHNDASIIQNGQQNKACIVQAGGSNEADINQEGTNNYLGLNQDVKGTSHVVQNGSATRDQSAENCGCRVVHCDASTEATDEICHQGLQQKVIVK